MNFLAAQNCVLTGFVGFFETVLYKDVMLSINPQTYSPNMVSWFPIVFPIAVSIIISDTFIIIVRINDLPHYRMQSKSSTQFAVEANLKQS